MKYGNDKYRSVDTYKKGMNVFYRAKEKTLHSLAGFGNKNKLLR